MTIYILDQDRIKCAEYLDDKSLDRMIRDIAQALDFKDLSKINKKSGCWEWKKAKDASGYGRIFRLKKTMFAHRLSYIKYKGLIPNKMEICHTCDNKSCVNPDHLFAGTHTDNIKDIYKKGYGNKGGYQLKVFCGEGNPNSKLTRDNVKTIRERYSEGVKQNELAKKFKVSQCHISDIVNYRKWSSI